MKKIVFVCRRNRFRSQIAEGLYNHLIKDNSYAESCGTTVLPEEEGLLFGTYERIANTVEAMKKHDIDITKVYSKQITPDRIKDADMIIILTDKKDVPEWLLSYPHIYWEIKDYPGKPTLEESEETIQILTKKILSLV